MRIEPLESRIAPAALHGQVLTYTDIDGDHVTLTISKGTLSPSDFTFSTGSVDGTTNTPQQLQGIAIENVAGIDGANITASAVRAGNGDGRASIGDINATGHDLGNVVISGDLETIECGSGSLTIPALKLLSVDSMGAYSTKTNTNSLTSTIEGAVGKIVIKHDLQDEDVLIQAQPAVGSIFVGGSIIGTGVSTGFDVGGNIHSMVVQGSLVGVSGGNSGFISATGSIKMIKIGGSILGGSSSRSGELNAGSFGTIQIGHDLRGGGGESSGAILATNGGIGSLTIGGSIIGDTGADQDTVGLVPPGQVAASAAIGTVRIGGNVIGGAGEYTGKIESLGTIGSVTIGGSLIGGTVSQTGVIASDGGSIASITIAHNFIGGSIGNSGTLDDSGEIYSSGHIGAVTIGGDFIAGATTGGTLDFSSAAIRAGSDLGPVKIGGSILGNPSGSVTILAVGQAMLTPQSHIDTAISSLTVAGTVRYAEILAGFNFDETPAGVESSIGPVKVGGDWIASDLVAGAERAGAPGWGAGDALQASSNDIAQIASISIGGAVEGLSTAHNFGFVSQQINSFKIGGQMLALHPGPDNDVFSFALTDTVYLEEL